MCRYSQASNWASTSSDADVSDLMLTATLVWHWFVIERINDLPPLPSPISNIETNTIRKIIITSVKIINKILTYHYRLERIGDSILCYNKVLDRQTNSG